MGEAGESSLITIIAIFLAAVLMFVFPLSAISEMNDQETLALVESYTTEFVNKIKAKGMITKDDYDEYIQKLYSTGNSYSVDFNVQVADTNPGKKTGNQQMGDTTSYGVYTSQVENDVNTKGKYLLKEGDYVNVSVQNTNTTISQMIKRVLYNVFGDEAAAVYTSVGGTVTGTGY